MAIRTVVTRGFGNGTFNGTIPLVVRRGYTIEVTTTASALVAHFRAKTNVSTFPDKTDVSQFKPKSDMAVFP